MESEEGEKVSYYDQDFVLDDWIVEASKKYQLLDILERPPAEMVTNEADSWQVFFGSHSTGQIYKPRRYICKEFGNYFDQSHVKSILEVGCGYGCTMFPLLEQYTFQIVATDYATKALDILQEHPLYDPSRIACEAWDITLAPSESLFLPEQSFGNAMILCIFALSAVLPQYHLQCFLHMKQILEDAKQKDKKSMALEQDYCILFRDYAIYDMTMFRHKLRFHEYGYQRHDGTYCYYFDVDYMNRISTEAGLEIRELHYATVINKNRKTKQELHRVFLHGVFALPSSNS
jgi:hypothetical protein